MGIESSRHSPPGLAPYALQTMSQRNDAAKECEGRNLCRYLSGATSVPAVDLAPEIGARGRLKLGSIRVMIHQEILAAFFSDKPTIYELIYVSVFFFK